jgi:phosphopantothenoylcysteine decarboxylase/phosphopantothenate--cysteine ligase
VPPGVAEVVHVGSAAELEAAVVPRAADQDVIVMAAAVADFRPKRANAGKTKKEDGPPEILLEATHDFLVDLGARKPASQVLVGFAAETDDLVANAAEKLRRKRLDLIVGNDVASADSGFEVDTNRAVLLDAAGGVVELPLLAKDALARVILEHVGEILASRSHGPLA